MDIGIRGLLVDAAVIVLALLFACRGARKGLYNSFMPYVVVVCSIASGIIGSRIYADYVTDYIMPTVMETIRNNVVQIGDQATEGANPALAILIQGFVEKVGLNTAVESAVRPVVFAAVRIAIFIVIFLVALIVLHIVKRLLEGIRTLPLIKGIDKIGGFIVGTVTCFVLLFIAVKVCDYLDVPFFREYSQNTYILSWFVE